MRSTSNLLLLVLVLALSCSVSCLEFDYADGTYACTPGEPDNCPYDWACRWSVEHNEHICFEDSNVTGTCDGVGSTCTGCCAGPERTGECQPGDDINACGVDSALCLACGLGESCTNGTCVADPCADDDALTNCEGECVDIQSDPNHCGLCNKVCEGDLPYCAGGECTGQCPDGLLECDGACVDTESDPNNCSDCNIQCEPGGSCLGGVCQCPELLTSCDDGSGAECVDTERHPAHCGICNSGECPIGGYCSGGNCTCRPGLSECDFNCVDHASDPDYCGGCAVTDCQGVTPICSEGACGDSCGASLSNCDLGFGQFCVDLSNNPLHCGACGEYCDSDRVCSAGFCMTYYPAVNCADCPAGDLCCPYPNDTALICVEGATDCPSFGI